MMKDFAVILVMLGFEVNEDGKIVANDEAIENLDGFIFLAQKIILDNIK